MLLGFSFFLLTNSNKWLVYKCLYFQPRTNFRHSSSEINFSVCYLLYLLPVVSCVVFLDLLLASSWWLLTVQQTKCFGDKVILTCMKKKKKKSARSPFMSVVTLIGDWFVHHNNVHKVQHRKVSSNLPAFFSSLILHVILFSYSLNMKSSHHGIHTGSFKAKWHTAG